MSSLKNQTTNLRTQQLLIFVLIYHNFTFLLSTPSIRFLPPPLGRFVTFLLLDICDLTRLLHLANSSSTGFRECFSRATRPEVFTLYAIDYRRSKQLLMGEVFGIAKVDAAVNGLRPVVRTGCSRAQGTLRCPVNSSVRSTYYRAEA